MDAEVKELREQKEKGEIESYPWVPGELNKASRLAMMLDNLTRKPAGFATRGCHH
jgi:hypothetical protein